MVSIPQRKLVIIQMKTLHFKRRSIPTLFLTCQRSKLNPARLKDLVSKRNRTEVHVILKRELVIGNRSDITL